MGCQAFFNAMVHSAHLGHESVNLVVAVSVVVVLLTFENVGLFFEEVLDKGLLSVGEVGSVVPLCIGKFEV